MLFSDNSLRLSTNYSKDAVCSFTLYNVFCSAFNLCTSWVVERSLSLITIRIPHCCIHVKLWTLQGSVSYASEWIMCNWAMELSGKTIYSFAFIAQKRPTTRRRRLSTVLYLCYCRCYPQASPQVESVHIGIGALSAIRLSTVVLQGGCLRNLSAPLCTRWWSPLLRSTRWFTMLLQCSISEGSLCICLRYVATP